MKELIVKFLIRGSFLVAFGLLLVAHDYGSRCAAKASSLFQ